MKVLIVEDNMTSALLLLTLVEKLDGYSAVCASTGAEAMRIAEAEPVDVVLMDYMLPDCDGLELSHRLRSLPHNRFAAIVMITSSYERNLRLACLESGIDEFLNKPVDVAELRLRLLNLGAVARMRIGLQRSLGDVLGRLEERLSLAEGALEPLRTACVHILADAPTGSLDATAIGRLRNEFEGFAAAVADACRDIGIADPGTPRRTFDNLDEIVLPVTSH